MSDKEFKINVLKWERARKNYRKDKKMHEHFTSQSGKGIINSSLDQ
jgi:hypothetical protein